MQPSALWRTTRWLTASLLGVWLVVTLAVVWFARDLQAAVVLGFPAGYWGAAAGALLVYLLIVLVYALAMDWLEARLQLHPAPSADAESLP